MTVSAARTRIPFHSDMPRLSRRAWLFASAALPAAIAAAAAADEAKPWQRARSLVQKADGERSRRMFSGAAKGYEEAARVLEGAGMRRWVAVTRDMAEMCLKLPLKMAGVRAGVYEGRAMGYEADVEVEVKVAAGGRIQEVRIAGQRESRALDSLQKIPKAIVTKQTPSVDAVSGATITSYAVMAAAHRALQSATNAPAAKP